VERALHNWRQHIAIDESLGLAGTTPQEGWAALAELFTPEGAQRQALVAQAVENASGEFTGQDIELHYRYRSAAVIGAEGATLGHTWLSGADVVSTLDLVPTGGFALLVGPRTADAWSAAVRTALAQLRIDGELLTVISVGTPESGAQWVAPGHYADVTDPGALLVRPDRHVAWRSSGGPDVTALTGALSTILARPTKG
jgi:2,4-dichlorophenol 6-monooxygenase